VLALFAAASWPAVLLHALWLFDEMPINLINIFCN
jgi:hypothetical protein